MPASEDSIDPVAEISETITIGTLTVIEGLLLTGQLEQTELDRFRQRSAPVFRDWDGP